MEALGKQASSYGAVCVDDSILSVEFSRWPYLLKTGSGEIVHALAVVIATGASPRFLNDTRKVPGEWEYMGQGVGTVPYVMLLFFKGKKIVVVGGGDSAVEEALYASYAESITMLVRGSSLRASHAMQARLKEIPSIKVLYQLRVDEILEEMVLQ